MTVESLGCLIEPMEGFYTTGYWRPHAGHEEEFIAAWTEFASWASEHDGAHELRLARDLGDPANFISFGLWDSLEQVHAWKQSPGFAERMPKVQAHATLSPRELEVVKTVDPGAAV